MSPQPLLGACLAVLDERRNPPTCLLALCTVRLRQTVRVHGPGLTNENGNCATNFDNLRTVPGSYQAQQVFGLHVADSHVT